MKKNFDGFSCQTKKLLGEKEEKRKKEKEKRKRRRR